jgi:3-hydroxyisobutyrate dehydrogenase
MTLPTLGFIGLGAMGTPIVHRLLDAGHSVCVWNRTPETLEPVLAAGARAAPTPAALTAASDVVLLCVTDTVAVEQVVFGADGVVEGAASDKLLVDHSTIHPLECRRLAERLRADSGMGWVDAPVSGGVAGAEAGRLVVMAGGAAADVERLESVAGAYSQQVTRMGECGAGQASKTCNQMIIGGTVAVVAEALNFAARFGVSAAALPDCLAGGWADSAVLQDHARRMAAADFGSDNAAEIMLKDMNIACDMGRATGAPMPVTAVTAELYRLLISLGHADKGQIGLIRLYTDRALD